MISKLIAKDLRAHHMTIMGYLLFGAVFINLTGRLSPLSVGQFVSSAALFVGVGVAGFLMAEKKGNVPLLIGSLPVTRTSVVLARYASSIVIAVIGASIWLAITWLSIQTDSGMTFTLGDIVTWKIGAIVAIIVSTQISIFFPAFFRLRTIGTTLMFVSAMFVPVLFSIKVLHTKAEEFVPYFVSGDQALYGVTGLTIAALLAVSMSLSLVFHRRRDL